MTPGFPQTLKQILDSSANQDYIRWSADGTYIQVSTDLWRGPRELPGSEPRLPASSKPRTW
eukprot:scaffold462_cov195-Pinguiococcus_pyrenoidosus.AAC.100